MVSQGQTKPSQSQWLSGQAKPEQHYVRAAELIEDSEDEDGTEDFVAADCASKWKPTTFMVLFGG